LTPDLVVLGNLLVDDIVFEDGRTRMAEAGGAVLHAAAAGALWVRVGVASVRGPDYPRGALDALAARSGTLLALSREIEKLRAIADASGALPPRAFDALAGGRAAVSVDRWAAAVLSGDLAVARAESNALAAEGSSGGNALWAVASIALAGLEPQAFAYRRGPAGPSLRPARARAALDAVYRADRAMKRGEIRDAEIRDVLERSLTGGNRGRDT
jgi:hypothetical protein